MTARSLADPPDMADMSPLGALILRAMRGGSIAAAVFIVMVIGIELWKLWRFEGSPGNYGFLAFLCVMFVGALWLARSIARELKRDGS
jgi:hypothetical protein